jgi:hypothetical protein
MAEEELQEPTGDLSALEDVNTDELNALADEGIGEGDFDDDCPDVPAELTDLYIDLEVEGVSPEEFKQLVDEGVIL